MKKLIAAALLLISSPSWASITFDSASVQLQVTTGVPNDFDVANASGVASTPGEMPVAALSRTKSADQITVSANGLISADFASTASAGFILELLDASRVAPAGSMGGSASLLGSFFYYFTSDTPFTATYSNAASFVGTTGGLVQLTSLADSKTVFSPELMGTGAVTSAVLAPGKYGFLTRVSSVAGPTTTDTSSASGRLSFLLAPAAVPEPAAWLLMIVGFGLVGAMMRRSGRPLRGAAV